VGLFAVGPGVYSWYGEGLGPAKGLFLGGGLGQFITQFLGAAAVGGMTVLLSSIFWLVLKATLGIRVTRQEELEGLDIGEHGMEAYSGFMKEASPSGFSESTNSGGISSGGDVPSTL